MPVSYRCGPFGAREVTLERPPRPIRLTFRIDVQNDPGHLTPIGTFRISIKHAEIGDDMLLVIDSESRTGRRYIDDVRIEWGLSHYRAREEGDKGVGLLATSNIRNVAKSRLSIELRLDAPKRRRDLPFLGQLDHVHGRLMACARHHRL
jgi:hypothetical protein